MQKVVRALSCLIQSLLLIKKSPQHVCVCTWRQTKVHTTDRKHFIVFLNANFSFIENHICLPAFLSHLQILQLLDL